MIYGLTHTQDGKPIVSPPALIKLAIGEPAQGKQGPRKLDHIQFKRYDPKSGEWTQDPELTEKFGPHPTEVEIVLLHDTPEEAFRTSYEMWASQQLLCRGNGLTAQRFFKELRRRNGRTEYTPTTEPIQVRCDYAERCPYLEEERCRPRGTLFFMLVDHPVIGTVCKITTGSFKSVRNIHSTLAEIYQARGTLRGLPLTLSVEAVTAYPKARDRKKTINFVWTLRFTGLKDYGAQFKKLLEDLTRPAALLGVNEAIKAHQLAESPQEIQAEFYPKNGDLIPEEEAQGENATSNGNVAHEPATQAEAEGTEQEVEWEGLF